MDRLSELSLLEHERARLKEVLDFRQWEAGDLAYKVRDCQIPLYNFLKNSTHIQNVVNCTRRFGKSHILFLTRTEQCLQNPDFLVRIVSRSKDQLNKIYLPIITSIFNDCPIEFMPELKIHEGTINFQNGSQISFFGGDEIDKIEGIRGIRADIFDVDEAGSLPHLEYLVDDIITPMMLDSGGSIFLLSTSPKSTAHAFVEYKRQARKDNAYISFTIDDNTYLSKENRNRVIDKLGGMRSPKVRRELYNEDVTDDESAIVPEWNNKYKKVIEDDKYTQLYKKYVGMDIGFRDKTALLFGYYNFKTAGLHIQKELIFKGEGWNTGKIADEIMIIENKLWPNSKDVMRWSDNNNLFLLQDLSTLHGIHFIPTSKDSLRAMVNYLRLFIGAGRLTVDPSCVELIQCLEGGVWDVKKDEFARSKTLGHFDALAALVYLVRNIDQNTNPIPEYYGVDTTNILFFPNKKENLDIYDEAFGL